MGNEELMEFAKFAVYKYNRDLLTTTSGIDIDALVEREADMLIQEFMNAQEWENED